MFAVDVVLMKALVVLIVLVFVDVILGAAIAIRKGEFSLEELPRFLRTEVLPYLVSLGGLVFLAMFEDVQQYGISALAWSAIVVYGSRMVFVELRKKVVVLFGPEVDLPIDKSPP